MLMREGVILAGLQPEMCPVKSLAEKIWKKHGQECVIVSGLDREHSAGSLHPVGLALDFRTRYFGNDQAEVVATELRTSLSQISDRYKVLFEGNHIHVQFKRRIS